MRYNTRKDFKRQIIAMIAVGKTNNEIWKAVGCNQKYPGIVRKELREMSEEERRAAIREATGKDPEPEPAQEEQKDSGFRTPYKHAKDRYIRSGY